MTMPMLATRSLSKTFGGVTAVDDVSLDFQGGQVHAIIGPNGAGKTTLINLLSGDILPDRGRMFYRGEDVTHFSAFQMSRIGLGRSYQSTNIFPDFTCWQNCWIGAQSRLPTSMRFLRPATGYLEVRARTQRALASCGLEHRRDLPPSRLSYGEQRQLEIGIMLATEPDLLLLDEPLAGMGPEESSAFVQLLQALAREHTLVLIEHDMDAVFALADVLTVMVNGRVLATGAPEEIRRNEAVQSAYLGGDVASP